MFIKSVLLNNNIVHKFQHSFSSEQDFLQTSLLLNVCESSGVAVMCSVHAWSQFPVILITLFHSKLYFKKKSWRNTAAWSEDITPGVYISAQSIKYLTYELYYLCFVLERVWRWHGPLCWPYGESDVSDGNTMVKNQVIYCCSLRNSQQEALARSGISDINDSTLIYRSN